MNDLARLLTSFTLAALLHVPAAAQSGQEVEQPEQSSQPSTHETKQPAIKPVTRSQENRRRERTVKAVEAMRKGEYVAAKKLFEEQIIDEPGNFVPLYNVACCHAMLGESDAAIKRLTEAVENGFCDAHHLRRDGSLASLRGDARLNALLANWPEILTAQRDANTEQAKILFPGDKPRQYASATDETLRLVYWSAANEKAFGEAREEAKLIGEFAVQTVFPELRDVEASREDAWVVVVLPMRPDFMGWLISTYGPGAAGGTTSAIGGAYEHDAKRLVSMDLGPTLRHELFHVFHWRDMSRRGQQHPIWIQEGLCSLVEDFDIVGGRVVPSTSWRTNITKRLEKLNRLMSISTLAAMTQVKFSGQRPLANYAQARSWFLFLHSQDKLTSWYKDYVAMYGEDQSGVKALCKVLETDEKGVDAAFRAWVRGLPSVSESIPTGGPSLGIEVDGGTGEGPVITKVDRPLKDGMRVGDIITSINGRPTRDMAELVRVLGTMQVGQSVEVEFRRVKLYKNTTVILTAKR